MPQGLTRSSILVPLIWLSLPAYHRTLLRPIFLQSGMDADEMLLVAEYWEQRGAREELALTR
eukprot:3393407-Alexandrium_andersonii.AAC.1